jgi:GT2 family glycosyltransferase
VSTRAAAVDGGHPGAAVRLRPEVRGKFLWVGNQKFYVKGVTYGAFEPDAAGMEYFERETIERDFARMADGGLNTVRIPHTMPPVSLLDAAERHGLKVMVGLSAEQYAGFLADTKDAPDVERIVTERVRAVAGHPALLCYALGNEIPASMVRWLGRRKVERYLANLYDAAKGADPRGIVTYVNYPSTEYLDLRFLDLLAFNVYLEAPDRLEGYLARLHTIAGDRPLLMSEVGLDALRNGEGAQSEVLDWQIRQAFASGCAGAVVFSWTDEWYRAGAQVDDWAFGITRRDRSPKPALDAVLTAFDEAPFPPDRAWPDASVVVCTHNGSRTLRATLDGLRDIEYPHVEVIVVDDGSSDHSAAIAEEFDVRLIRTPNRGLASARNVGAAAASGEIVAYLDDDAWPDPHWLQYLADTFERTGCGAAGGPNVPPPAGLVAESVAHSPGGPIHVLVSDSEAEHIPGCNFAIRKDVVDALGGFDPQFRTAGDDVDLCWRLQEAGYGIGFNPAAMVWHHRRTSVGGYCRQQRGYGRAEALLERKWPQRFNAAGHVTWDGRVYGNSFAQLLRFRRSRVYGGVWGFAPFQSIYYASPGLVDSLARLPEWNLVIALLGVLCAMAIWWSPLVYVLPLLALAVLLPVSDAVYAGLSTRFGPHRRRRLWLVRATTVLLHLAQPLARLIGRTGHGLTPWHQHVPAHKTLPRPREVRIWSEDWRDPEQRLADMYAAVSRAGLAVRMGGPYDRWDFEVRGGMFGSARLLFAAEDHGAGAQYLRFRITPRYSRATSILSAALLALAVAAALDGAWIVAAVITSWPALLLWRSARECGIATVAARSALAAPEDDAQSKLELAFARLAAPAGPGEER